MNAAAYPSVAADRVQPWVHHSRMACTVTRSHSNRTLLGCSAEGEKGVYSEIQDKIFGKSFCTFRTTKTTSTALPLFSEDWVYLYLYLYLYLSRCQYFSPTDSAFVSYQIRIFVHHIRKRGLMFSWYFPFSSMVMLVFWYVGCCPSGKPCVASWSRELSQGYLFSSREIPPPFETRLFQWLFAQFGKPEFLSVQCFSFLSVLTRDWQQAGVVQILGQFYFKT